MNNAQVSELLANGLPKGELTDKQVSAWLGEVETAKQREKAWRLEAGKITALYEGYKRDQSPFNILYSNTETLGPALYNNTPRPAVGRRFKDKDPLGAAVSLTLNRTLIYVMDPNAGDEFDFDDLAEHAILQALVPGRGAARFKYEADYVEGTKVAQTPQQIKNSPAEGEAAQTAEEAVEEPPVIGNERICGETVEYDRLTHGYARKWKQVPWIALEHHMTKEELEENFGAEIAAKVTVTELEQDENEEGGTKDGRKVAVVQELWDKAGKRILFLTAGLKDRELKIVPDPLGISGFFPMAEPLNFMGKVSSLTPQPIYNMYREQAEELNLITRRITAVIDCLKVRGAYDSTLTELAKVLRADDGELVAIENVLSMDNKTLKDAIFLMPLGELVSVLQQLYVQRTQVKTVIYEITGISDIIRGSSAASETATAQQIKNQWGTLRLKKMQKAVSKWCKRSLRIAAEIASKKFSQETFMKMTMLPYVTAEQKAQAQQAMQAFQMQQAQMQQPGQPPAPPQPPPQQLTDVLATPVWEEVVALMRDTVGMEFRVDIELNSTIADDLAEDQKNVGELLNALSQFLNGVAPLIENGAMPFEVAKTIMLGIVRKMAMGPEVEDQLEKMQAPKPPEAEKAAPPPPVDPNTAIKAEAEQMKLKLEMQKMQQEMAQAAEEHKNKMEAERQKATANQAKFEQQMLMIRQKAAQPATPPQGAQ